MRTLYTIVCRCGTKFVAYVQSDGPFETFAAGAQQLNLPIVRREANLGSEENPVFGCPGCHASIGSLGDVNQVLN